MNKKELINEVAKVTGYSKKDVGAVVDTVFTTIADNVANGTVVNIPRFGKFEVTERAARNGRNPYTGESIVIPAKKSPKFKFSSVVKNAVAACA